ncbi:hypothetical protein Tco_1122851 [Tanacetum coccineum]|uniref:Gag-Pol polyprotein n=1 Tax=Tanacetum coccineum TaxID=301880 RepID=A0ABQ5J291_9ASTR
MSTSTTHQQSLTNVGSETRHPMLERGSYIPWASRFRRYVNPKRENQKWLNKAIDEGPYAFHMFTPDDTTVQRMQNEDDLRGDELKYYEAEIEAMNLILIFIPNDIYNYVNACTTAKAMWKRVECLMRGNIQNKVGRETRFNNKFDQFVAEPGEALVSVYNRFAQLMNDLERNDIIFPLVIVNTKFLNCLQPEWLKYVTQVHLAKRLTEDTFDDLFDYLQQFEKLVNASQAKKNTTPYYVIHSSSMIDYVDDYQKDVQTNSEDPLTSAMLLLAHANTQNFSNPTNNRLRTSSNTRNQAIVQGDKINIQSRNFVHYARNCTKPRVQDSKYFMEQILLAKHDEAGVILTDEQNDLLFVDASRIKEIEELSANICLMAIMQPANTNSAAGPIYDSTFVSENCWTIDYKKLNALYEDFVPQKELYAEQKYFSYAFISSEKSSNATSSYYSSKKASMPRLKAESSVRRPMNRYSQVKNSVFANTKKSRNIVEVYVRKNKTADIAYENIVSNKEHVIDVDVANPLKAKDVLCVSCAKNVLIPYHDKCLANYKLNVHSKVRRALFTTPRSPKSSDTTSVVSKTRFSEKLAHSKFLATTPVVSKTKIEQGSSSNAKNMVSSAFKKSKGSMRDSSLGNYMKNKIRTSQM